MWDAGSRVEFYLEIGLIGLVIYGLWAFYRYWSNIMRPMRALKRQLDEFNLQKQGLLTQYLEGRSKHFEARFDHLRYANAYDAVQSIQKNTKALKRDLGGFKSEIMQSFEDTQDQLDALYFDNNLFESSIIELEDLSHYKSDSTVHDFLNDKEGRTIKAYYEAYREEGNLKKLDHDLNGYYEDRYKKLREKDVYDFVYRDRHISKKTDPSTRMRLLNDSAQVYINLKDFGTGEGTEDSTNIYLNKLGENDANNVISELDSQGADIQGRNELTDKNRLSIFRAKRGFPAFKISGISECKNIYESLTGSLSSSGHKEEDFYIDNDYISASLFPGSLRMGNKKDDVRIAVTKALVTELIEQQEGNFVMANRPIGKNKEEVITYLKSLRGEKEKEYLFENSESYIKEIVNQKGQPFLVKLIQRYASVSPDLDNVDRQILDDWLRTLI